jgi:hypothetical protein
MPALSLDGLSFSSLEWAFKLLARKRTGLVYAKPFVSTF